MIILALDTSGPVAGVAVMRDSVLAYEAVAINKKTHSANIMPMIDEALARADARREDITLLAATVGPGSFTGVRIGVAVAKGLSMALSVPVVPVNTLEALALGVCLHQGVVAPILDARGGQVYAAAFQTGEGDGCSVNRVLPDAALKLTDFIDQVCALTDGPLFVGDGVPVHMNAISSIMPHALFAPEPLRILRPSVAALYAIEHQDAAISGAALAPLYLRAPQAERARLARDIK